MPPIAALYVPYTYPIADHRLEGFIMDDWSMDYLKFSLQRSGVVQRLRFCLNCDENDGVMGYDYRQMRSYVSMPM